MAADFFFSNPTFEIPSLRAIAVFKWERLKNSDVQYAVAAEEQYLNFHLHMLDSLRHTRAGHLANPPYAYELGLSVRAGAVKAAVLMAGSILEAALRAIAEVRAYELNKDPRRRTFGNVLRAWEHEGKPREDVAPVWAEIQAVHEVRNFVHLHKAATEGNAGWEKVLSSEEALLNGALKAINHVASIEA